MWHRAAPAGAQQFQQEEPARLLGVGLLLLGVGLLLRLRGEGQQAHQPAALPLLQGRR